MILLRHASEGLQLEALIILLENKLFHSKTIIIANDITGDGDIICLTFAFIMIMKCHTSSDMTRDLSLSRAETTCKCSMRV